jgi:hypothetical protein
MYFLLKNWELKADSTLKCNSANAPRRKAKTDDCFVVFVGGNSYASELKTLAGGL